MKCPKWAQSSFIQPQMMVEDRYFYDPIANRYTVGVKAHPAGASPFGVMDMGGNVWQWTDEYLDEHTRAGILRGRSYYQPQGSIWYFPLAYKLNEHG